MSLNCNEINLILKELDLSGAFIQDIIQPGFDTVALCTYKNGAAKTVIICTKPNSCRINETYKKIPKNDKPLRFMEFLRSKIRGYKIASCKQIDLERIIKMELRHGAEDEYFNMFIRLWSSAANIILCDKNNNILDSMYRRPSKGEVSGRIYIPPEINETETARASKENKAENYKPAAADSANGITSIPTELPPKDSYPIRRFDDIEEEYRKANPSKGPLTFNQKIDIWYSEYAQALSREALLEQAKKWYNSHKSRQENALERLTVKQKNFKNAVSLKHQGDLILSCIGRPIDKNSNFLECRDFTTGSAVRIKIDPSKTVQENAAAYYNRYKKEMSGATELEYEIDSAKKALAALERSYEAIKKETNPIKIEQMLRKSLTPKQQEKKNRPGLDYTVDGWYILVGRDADENDELLRRHAKGSDLWLHTRDCPGGFVFIKNREGKTVPLKILLYAGNLAVYHSKARKSKKADLYYTHVKYLRRAKNGPKGLVIPTQEKNLTIELDDRILKELDQIRAQEEEP
ncbi:NFACT RNA binding domain-containing protein [Treponema parvum]|uniref:NFACT RNA binding domain-containing protein n=1 Tax=Treponema parvum TaxID=138851 RepID=UPI001AEBF909|nr:NFACT family protein [Treponema parvum]QTQ16871.1 fibronectin-binding domain-containing protein [Treponema parvum]